MIKLNRKASQGHVKTISANSKEDYMKERNILFKPNCPQIQIDISNSNKFLSQQFIVHSTASASGSTTTWDQSSTSSPTSKNGKNVHKSHRSIEINLVDYPATNGKDKQLYSSGLHQLGNIQSSSISTTSQQNNHQYSSSNVLDSKPHYTHTAKMNSFSQQFQSVPTQNKENLMPSPKSEDKSNPNQFQSGVSTQINSVNQAQMTVTGGQVNNQNSNNSNISITSNSNYIGNATYTNNGSSTINNISSANINNMINNNNNNNNNNNLSGNSTLFSFNGNTSALGATQNNTSNNSNNSSNIIHQGTLSNLNTQANGLSQQQNQLKLVSQTSPSSRLGSTSLLSAPYQYLSKGQSKSQLGNQLSAKLMTQQSVKTQPQQYDDENQPDLQNRIQLVPGNQSKQHHSITQTTQIQITQGSSASGEIKQVKKKPLDPFKPTSKERAITSPIGSSKLCQNLNNIAINSFNFLPSNTTSNNSSLIVNIAGNKEYNIQNNQLLGATTPTLSSLTGEQIHQNKNNFHSQSTTQSPLIAQQKHSLFNHLQSQSSLSSTLQSQINLQSSVQGQSGQQQNSKPNNDIKLQQAQANQFLQSHKNISQLIQQQIESDLKSSQLKQKEQNQSSQLLLKKKDVLPAVSSPKPEFTLKSDKSQKSITLVVGKVDNSKRVSEVDNSKRISEMEEQRSGKKGIAEQSYSVGQSNLQEELQKLKLDNEKIMKELTIYKVDRDLYEKDKEYMSKEREFFQSEKDLLNKQIEEMQKEIKSRENNDFSSQKTKEAESQFLKERIFQLEKRNKDLEEEYNLNSKIYKDTITKNQEVYPKYEALKNEYDQVNQNLKIQTSQLNSTQIELERLKLKSVSMEQEEEDLKQNLKNLNDRLLLTQAETIELKKKNKDLQADIDQQIPYSTTIQNLEFEVEQWKLKHSSLERVINEERMRSSFSYQNSESSRQSVAGLEIGYLRQNLTEKDNIIMELKIQNQKITQQVKNLEIEIQQKQQTIDSQAQQFQQNIGQQQHFEFEHQKKKIIQLQEEADQQFNQYIQTRKELEMKNKELDQLKNHLAQQKESNEQNELQSYKKLLEDCRNELGDVYQLMNSRKRDADLAQRQLAEQKEIMEELKNKSRGQETELLCLRETYDNVARELEKTIKQYEQYKKVYEMQSVELHHKNREILELLQETDVLKIKYEDLLQQQAPQSENTKHSRVITKMTFSRAEEEFNADLF